MTRATWRALAWLALALTLPEVVMSDTAAACSLAAPAFTMTATVISKGSGSVSYHVKSIEHFPGATDAESAPTRDSTVPVHYFDDERFLTVGQDYLVTVWRDPSSGELGSGVLTAEDGGCGGDGTLHADGTSIDTARKLFGIRLWIVYPILGLAAMLLAFGLVLSLLRVVTRAREREVTT